MQQCHVVGQNVFNVSVFETIITVICCIYPINILIY